LMLSTPRALPPEGKMKVSLARAAISGAYAAYLRDPAGNKITAYTFI
jgi:hypothetical protein